MKKIMFNDKYGLTQAVLEGHKTQTRRILEKQNFVNPFSTTCLGKIHINEIFKEGVISRYAIGEEIAVAQSYLQIKVNEVVSIQIDLNESLLLDKFAESKGWKNKMFVKAKYMPHRIKITNIRLERLQDISYDDCLKEGVEKLKWEHSNDFYYMTKATPHRYNLAKDAFASLIDKVSGKGTWESNPWVFVYDFDLIK